MMFSAYIADYLERIFDAKNPPASIVPRFKKYDSEIGSAVEGEMSKVRTSLTKETFKKERWMGVVWDRTSFEDVPNLNRPVDAHIAVDATSALAYKQRMAACMVHIHCVCNSLHHAETVEEYLWTEILPRQESHEVTFDFGFDDPVVLKYTADPQGGRTLQTVRRLNIDAGSLFSVDFQVRMMGNVLTPLTGIEKLRITSAVLDIVLVPDEKSLEQAIADKAATGLFDAHIEVV
jgi:hypothetical protein